MSPSGQTSVQPPWHGHGGKTTSRTGSRLRPERSVCQTWNRVVTDSASSGPVTEHSLSARKRCAPSADKNQDGGPSVQFCSGWRLGKILAALPSQNQVVSSL